MYNDNVLSINMLDKVIAEDKVEDVLPNLDKGEQELGIDNRDNSSVPDLQWPGEKTHRWVSLGHSQPRLYRNSK